MTLILLLEGWVSVGQEVPSWKIRAYHSLLDGNELYGDCQAVSMSVDKLYRECQNGRSSQEFGSCITNSSHLVWLIC